MNTINERCFKKAVRLVETGAVSLTEEMNLFDFADLLVKLEQEKLKKEIKSDACINYNDEIVSIEEIGIKDTIDISVSGDNLFYCNGILTKNSWGLPATADLMIALITTDELEKAGQIMVKQLKNRYNTKSTNKKFILGLNYSKMKFSDVKHSEFEELTDSKTKTTETSGFGSGFGKGKGDTSDWNI
jgi:hypothetical protein